jgi:hypothetical protein
MDETKKTMTVKLPHWLKGAPPAKPRRGISGDLALAMGTRMADRSQEPMNERAQRYMGVAIEAAMDQEQQERAEYARKLCEYEAPLMMPLGEFVAWLTVPAFVALLLIVMWTGT